MGVFMRRNQQRSVVYCQGVFFGQEEVTVDFIGATFELPEEAEGTKVPVCGMLLSASLT